MKIIPLTSDSIGVRSMAMYVETKDCKILIDPSAAIGQKRYKLTPSKQEQDALSKAKHLIASYAKQSDILTISHYHYDHYETESKIYKNKTVYAKDIEKHINKSQQQRGKELFKQINKLCTLQYCDDTIISIGDTTITFSPPFFHGPENTRLGYVIMTTIDDGITKVVHSSDVQGPVSEKAKRYIIRQQPDLLILDGPPTHMLGFRFSKKNLQKASDNLIEILHTVPCEVILDHHLLRDLKYQNVFSQPYSIGKHRIKTFAEYLGKKNNTLEAHRKDIWRKEHGI